jgi:threonine dehydratase
VNVLPSLDDVRAARERIRPYARTTPTVSDDEFAYKLEFLQHTGSFKPRGAFNAALQLDGGARARGFVTVSGGNHGMALAYVGATLHVPVTVFMPQTTPRYVTDFVRDRGADVRLAETMADAFEGCRAPPSSPGRRRSALKFSNNTPPFGAS